MGRRAIEVIIDLLDVLAVIALAIGQPEETLLQNRVMPVPQRYSQAYQLPPVAPAGDAVLAPAIGPAAGVIMREILPGVAVLAVILADGAPLPLADIGPPAVPRHAALGLPQTTCLGSSGERALAAAWPALVHCCSPAGFAGNFSCLCKMLRRADRAPRLVDWSSAPALLLAATINHP